MRLRDFVRSAQRGEVLAGAGGFDAATDVLADGVGVLDAADLEALTAEAYNQDVLPPDLEWERGLALVRAALEGRDETTPEQEKGEKR